jgi:nitroreductase
MQTKDIDPAAMGQNLIVLDRLRDTLAVRYSARAFLSEVLPRERIERLLETAALSPSWCNTQPWKAYVASGTVLAKISKDLVEAARDRCDSPDIPFVPDYPEPYGSRKREADETLRLARGLKATDYRGLVDAVRTNWRFFNAPQALFLTVPKSFGPYALLDLGCFLQSFLLACVADGLAACPQASLAQYPRAVRSHLLIEEDELIACAVSFGVPDPDAGANKCRTSRIRLSDFAHFQDQ